MVTPIRIGNLVLHLSQLCYAREHGGQLILFMSCGQLVLEGAEASIVRRYLHKHSEVIGEPELPRWQQRRPKVS